METAITLLLTFVGNIISVWIILEMVEKLLEVQLPKEKRRKYFWLSVTFSTFTSFIIGF
ncbi:hypothetical protein P4V41_11020 [Fictibacillus nanhaiensis]|uniref:hypothetical protein n=1 Tax=Fictibacillus nanhaiensis TaxID=742169 RepID=UPI002E228620|nr:hypothetical protein [Fictibacillus nanhaiensis]